MKKGVRTVSMRDRPGANGPRKLSGTNGYAASATSGSDVRKVVTRDGVACVTNSRLGGRPTELSRWREAPLVGKCWGNEYPLRIDFLED